MSDEHLKQRIVRLGVDPESYFGGEEGKTFSKNNFWLKKNLDRMSTKSEGVITNKYIVIIIKRKPNVGPGISLNK